MERKIGNIRLFIMDGYDKMSEKCADLIAVEINAKPSGVFGFATGGTPEGAYAELIKKHKDGNLDFSGITTFNLDEYYPLKKSSDQSYDYFMKQKLFSHVNIDFSRVNIPNGEAADPEAECILYEEKIKNAGGIDLQLLGIGHNGHIGFNEPAETFTKGTNHIALDESTISANARYFASPELVPKNAVTMGIKTIMMTRKILLIANGEKKAHIVKEALFGQITPKIPASALQMHQNITVVIDKEAAAEIIPLIG